MGRINLIPFSKLYHKYFGYILTEFKRWNILSKSWVNFIDKAKSFPIKVSKSWVGNVITFLLNILLLCKSNDIVAGRGLKIPTAWKK